jgi:hypothetical protein
MDLQKLNSVDACEKGAVLSIVDPRDEETILTDDATKEPITITVIGRDSKLYQEQQHKAVDKRINRRIAKGKKEKLSSAELEDDTLETLVKCTRAWSHIAYGGKELECTPENVRMIYTNVPWLREQVNEFIGDRANFLGNL